MEQMTPAEYKSRTRSSQQKGGDVDRLRRPFTGDLRHTVRTLLRRGERTIELDLAAVSRIDAAGIGELVRAYTTAIACNGALRIVNTIPRVREMLERVGLFDRLTAGPNR